MEDPYPVENIDRLGFLMFQTSDNSQLLRRVLWISAELTIVSSLKHKNTQPRYSFNRVRVLYLDRLKEGTWLHSFDLHWQNDFFFQKLLWIWLILVVICYKFRSTIILIIMNLSNLGPGVWTDPDQNIERDFFWSKNLQGLSSPLFQWSSIQCHQRGCAES